MSKCAVCGVAGNSATLWEDALGNQLCNRCLEEKSKEAARCAMEGCRENHKAGQAVCDYHYTRIMLLWQ